jgi:hypothetical protein
VRYWSLFQNCFAWLRLVEDTGRISYTAAKTPRPQPNQVFRDILRKLIEKLGMEVHLFVEHDLCAGVDA